MSGPVSVQRRAGIVRFSGLLKRGGSAGATIIAAGCRRGGALVSFMSLHSHIYMTCEFQCRERITCLLDACPSRSGDDRHAGCARFRRGPVRPMPAGGAAASAAAARARFRRRRRPDRAQDGGPDRAHDDAAAAPGRPPRRRRDRPHPRRAGCSAAVSAASAAACSPASSARACSACCSAAACSAA